MTQQPRTPTTLRLTGEQLASIEPPISEEWFIDVDEYEDFVVAADLLVQIEKVVLEPGGLVQSALLDAMNRELTRERTEAIIAAVRAAIRSAAPVDDDDVNCAAGCSHPSHTDPLVGPIDVLDEPPAYTAEDFAIRSAAPVEPTEVAPSINVERLARAMTARLDGEVPDEEWDAEFNWHRDENDYDKALAFAPYLAARLTGAAK